MGDSGKALELWKRAYTEYREALGSQHTLTKMVGADIHYLQPELLLEELKRPNAVKTYLEDTKTLQIKEVLQEYVLNKIQDLAAQGSWSDIYWYYPGNWGVKGYVDKGYIKQYLGDLGTNEENVSIALKLCFEAINLGIIKYQNSPLSCAQEFSKVYQPLIKKIAEESPRYFIDKSIAEVCIQDETLKKKFLEQNFREKPLYSNDLQKQGSQDQETQLLPAKAGRLDNACKADQTL